MSDDPLASARAKVEWAKRHLNSLQEDFTHFVSQKPYATRINFDAKTGWYILTMQVLKPFNPDWPLTIGDAIQNLRNALDHIAWAFALDYGEGKEPSCPKEVEFPITSSSGYFARAQVKKWISSDQLAFLEKRQPYVSGNHQGDPLWVLKELSNRDKHRVLHTIYAHSHDLSNSGMKVRYEWDENILGKIIDHEFFPDPELFLTDGAQFGRIRFERTDPAAKVEMKSQVVVDMAFGDSGWKVRFPDIGLIGSEVGSIIEDAAPLLR